MRTELIVLLFVTLAVVARPAVARPAGGEFWNTCNSGDPCSGTAIATPSQSLKTASPSETSSEAPPTAPLPTAPTENPPGFTPPAGLPPQSAPDTSTYTYGDNTITIQLGVTGSILIVLGIHLMIFGFQSFRPTLAVTGFLEFGLVTWIGLINAKPAEGYARDDITMIAVPAGVAVVGAILYAYFSSVSSFLVGAMGGFTFGMFILLWREDLVIVNDIGRYCFLGGLAVVCAALVRFTERHVILKSTSFTGAFIFIVGVDCLAHIGYLSGVIQLFDRNPHHERAAYEIDGRIYGLMVGIILLFLVSFAWQFFFNLGKRFGVEGGILSRILHRAHEKAEIVSGRSHHGDDPEARSSSERQSSPEHHIGSNNLVNEVVHRIEEAIENHGNHSNNSQHHS
ncbi:hypothetical protein BX666DRAFT_1885967 [Dichotomocladium elegans]|nr:hypothetical protein BX666DRAFT_1885967 [Dichotomocladium elegans]